MISKEYPQGSSAHFPPKHPSFQAGDPHSQGMFQNVLLPVSSLEKRDGEGYKLDLNAPVHLPENPESSVCAYCSSAAGTTVHCAAVSSHEPTPPSSVESSRFLTAYQDSHSLQGPAPPSQCVLANHGGARVSSFQTCCISKKREVKLK